MISPDPASSRSYAFPKQRRLRRSQDFQAIYAFRQTARDRHLLLFGRLQAGQPTRIGLSVSRKLGGAVQRARYKRLLREAFRLNQHEIPDELDLILIPQRGVEPSLDDYSQSLKRLSRKLKRRLEQSAESSGAADE